MNTKYLPTIKLSPAIEKCNQQNAQKPPTTSPNQIKNPNKMLKVKNTVTSSASSTSLLPTNNINLKADDSQAALITLDGPGLSNNDGKDESDVQQQSERGNWTGRFDFLLSLLGYSVGLGNVWRFPYLCYNNGGGGFFFFYLTSGIILRFLKYLGAFLIPFSIMLIIAGLPLMFMELSFGQYAALGPVAIYRRFCPLFRGLGIGMVIVSAIVMLYYNQIIAWTIFYMIASFRSELPWQNCEPEWSTQSMFSKVYLSNYTISSHQSYFRLLFL